VKWDVLAKYLQGSKELHSSNVLYDFNSEGGPVENLMENFSLLFIA
jgi:hypothetical protein